uniref:Uncharacterized protein n=1 Tax=Romanomermis culicivorax TaxID=13658 RepID=A0A915JCT2_ROMCU
MATDLINLTMRKLFRKCPSPSENVLRASTGWALRAAYMLHAMQLLRVRQLWCQIINPKFFAYLTDFCFKKSFAAKKIVVKGKCHSVTGHPQNPKWSSLGHVSNYEQ